MYIKLLVLLLLYSQTHGVLVDGEAGQREFVNDGDVSPAEAQRFLVDRDTESGSRQGLVDGETGPAQNRGINEFLQNQVQKQDHRNDMPKEDMQDVPKGYGQIPQMMQPMPQMGMMQMGAQQQGKPGTINMQLFQTLMREMKPGQMPPMSAIMNTRKFSISNIGYFCKTVDCKF